MGKINFFKKRSSGERKNTEPHPVDLKLTLIKEYKSGGASYRSLSKKSGISPGLIAQWVKRVDDISSNNQKAVLLSKFKLVSKVKEESESQKVKALQKALEDALLKNKALEKMIDIAEDELKINIRKKSGTKPSRQ